MNTSYARLAKGRIEYAPSAIATPHGVTINPSRITYLAHGWKLLDLQPPSDPPPFGKEYAVTGYTETATDIRANWKLVPRESSPRTFSKLKVVIALTRIGKWAAIRDWLNETEYGDLFDAAQDFREDNADLIAALSAAQGRFGFTDEETAVLLAECVAD